MCSLHKHTREIKKSGSICYGYMLIYCRNIHKVDATEFEYRHGRNEKKDIKLYS